MPRYIITEAQYVTACRLVEADTEDEALEKFWAGEGAEYGHDGDVADSTLISIVEEDT